MIPVAIPEPAPLTVASGLATSDQDTLLIPRTCSTSNAILRLLKLVTIRKWFVLSSDDGKPKAMKRSITVMISPLGIKIPSIAGLELGTGVIS